MEIVTLELWILSHNMCVMIRNLYLKFEEETLKSKEVIIFLKENSKFKG
jgi:hypothetical protein